MKLRLFFYQYVSILLVLTLSQPIVVAQKSAKSSLTIKEIKATPFLCEVNGVDFQVIRINAECSADSSSARVFVEGNDPYIVQFKKGENSLEIPVKSVEAQKLVKINVEWKNKVIHQSQLSLQPVKKLTCYILPHSHTDIGYTEIQTAIEDKQVENLVKGMEIAKKTAQYPEGSRFVWNVEVGWAADLFLNRMNDQQQKDFFDAVSRGEVALNGMYLNVLTGLCRPEELSRLFKFSTELAKRSNVPITAAMTSDIPGQTWGTVTAMSQAGIRYFSTAPNYFDRIGDILVQWENKPFYWVSPSGNEKVLVWIPFKGYALSHTIKQFSTEFVERFYHQLDSMGYTYDIAHVRWSGIGDNAEPDPEICEFVKDWNTKYSSPRFIISSTSSAFEAFETKYSDKLQRIKGDWTPYWEDGAGSSAYETAMNRASSDRLSQAEAILAMKNQGIFPVAQYEAAWKKVLLYSEHTWGAWCSVSDPENSMTKEQWEIKRSYAEDAQKQSQELLHNALGTENSKQSSITIEVYNTNSWPRSGVILVPQELSKAGDRVVGSDKKLVMSQRLSTGELAVLVKSIPPFSSVLYEIVSGSAYSEGEMKIGENSLDNGLISVRVDKVSGAISEFKSIQTKGINLVNSASGYGLNDFAFLASNKVDDIKRVGNVKITVAERGPLVASLRIESEAPGCNKLVREVRLMAGQEYLELINMLDKKRAEISKKSGSRLFSQMGGKESVNFAFPFQVPEGKVRLDVVYGVMEPEKDQIPSACKNWLTANRWADVSNNETGVALVTLDAPLFEVGEITATLLGSQTDPNVWRKHIEPTQTLFSWALNNHWGTNYRAYQDGIITFRYALYPHQKFDAAANSKLAINLSQPLIVTSATADKSTLSGIYPDQPQVIVTAFKPCDNGTGRMLTLFNSSEKAVETKLITAGNSGLNVWKSNSGEENIQKIDSEIEIPAWGTVVLRVE